MRDVLTVMWKEFAELRGNRRFFWVFLLAVVAMGVLPSLSFSHHGSGIAMSTLGPLFLALYVLLATVIVVANTAPDLVLHERVGHSLDYLLTTRLSDRAIFGAKVITAFCVGYVGALLATLVQMAAVAALSGDGFRWLFLATSQGRIVGLGITAGLSLYVAVIGTFVALRIGEQRAAYMVTILSVGLLLVPFLTGWLHFSLKTVWLAHAALWLAVVGLALFSIGMRLFRRDMLVLYLQE